MPHHRSYAARQTLHGYVHSLTIDDSYRPIDSIRKQGHIPVLIIHSRTDEVIPFHRGEELYEAAQEPKEFWAVN